MIQDFDRVRRLARAALRELRLEHREPVDRVFFLPDKAIDAAREVAATVRSISRHPRATESPQLGKLATSIEKCVLDSQAIPLTEHLTTALFWAQFAMDPTRQLNEVEKLYMEPSVDGELRRDWLAGEARPEILKRYG